MSTEHFPRRIFSLLRCVLANFSQAFLCLFQRWGPPGPPSNVPCVWRSAYSLAVDWGGFSTIQTILCSDLRSSFLFWLCPGRLALKHPNSVNCGNRNSKVSGDKLLALRLSMLGSNLVSDLLRQFFGWLSFLHAYCGAYTAEGDLTTCKTNSTVNENRLLETNYFLQLLKDAFNIAWSAVGFLCGIS